MPKTKSTKPARFNRIKAADLQLGDYLLIRKHSTQLDKVTAITDKSISLQRYLVDIKDLDYVKTLRYNPNQRCTLEYVGRTNAFALYRPAKPLSELPLMPIGKHRLLIHKTGNIQYADQYLKFTGDSYIVVDRSTRRSKVQLGKGLVVGSLQTQIVDKQDD